MNKKIKTKFQKCLSRLGFDCKPGTGKGFAHRPFSMPFLHNLRRLKLYPSFKASIGHCTSGRGCLFSVGSNFSHFEISIAFPRDLLYQWPLSPSCNYYFRMRLIHSKTVNSKPEPRFCSLCKVPSTESSTQWVFMLGGLREHRVKAEVKQWYRNGSIWPVRTACHVCHVSPYNTISQLAQSKKELPSTISVYSHMKYLLSIHTEQSLYS